jgi:glucose/arabinose dehydrogenase
MKRLSATWFGVLLAMTTLQPLSAQTTQPDTQPAEDFRKGVAAMGDWSTDGPGVRRLITVDDLPKPNDTPSASNPPRIVARPEGAWPKAPSGFEVDLFAKGLSNPRKIITAPNGDLFVVESGPGRIKVLRQNDTGDLIDTKIFAKDLTQPFGMAFYPPGNDPKYLYVANTNSVVRFAYHNGDLQATGAPEMIVNDIPGGGHLQGGGHWTRDIVFSLDGKKMYVSVGSHSNVSDDAAEFHRASVHEYNPDGSGFRIYASGIRNAVGLAVQPENGRIWASVNERDALGDNLVPDYITHIDDGGFYGWPWFYIGNHQDPRQAGKHPELGAKTLVPDVLLESHAASLCMTFYEGNQFPAMYRGVAFAAEHGSWNRAKRVGSKLIYVPLKDGKATGDYVDFLTGFGASNADVWGRLVGVTVDRQGSIITVDDGGNCIWRVRYTGKK